MSYISPIFDAIMRYFFMTVMLFAVPMLVFARADALPVPILPDDTAPSVLLHEEPLSIPINTGLPNVVLPVNLPHAPVIVGRSHWAVQLSAGNSVVLEKDALRLRPEWPDARVVLIDGRAKLVVGFETTPAQATVLLKSLRSISAQAFVRRVPDDNQLTSSFVAEPKEESATSNSKISTELVTIKPDTPDTEELVPVKPDVNANEQIIIEPSAPVKPNDEVIVSEPETMRESDKAPSESSPPLSDIKTQESPVAPDANSDVLNISDAISPDVVVDDDVLPAIVAVAQTVKPDASLEADSELQAAADLLDGNDGNTMQVESESVLTKESKEASVEILVLNTVAEKRGIVLPMRPKEEASFKPEHELVEPLNLMLSPLYFLPTDTDITTQNENSTILTMQTVLQALVKPTVIPILTPETTTIPITVADSKEQDKTKLFMRIAELANTDLWEMALPLAKETRKFENKQLSNVDCLLLGWVWLQNKDPKMAKRYFQTSLKKQPQDEARYALGLSLLLLGDKVGTQSIIKEMAISKQREHLQTLLAR
jgi:hypothetical protein